VYDEENEVTIVEQHNDFPRQEETVEEEQLVSFCWLWAEELVGTLERMERVGLGTGRAKREREGEEVEEGREGKERGRAG